MKRLTTFAIAVMLLPCLAPAGPLKADYRLKPNLKVVVKTGDVRPVEGITAAGQPNKAALKVFADNGYTTVIDLRTKDEDRGFKEAAFVERLGMDYVAMPIDGSDEINFENARKLDELIKQAEGPVLVHCASSNRAGGLPYLAAAVSQ